jgi:spore germination protein
VLNQNLRWMDVEAAMASEDQPGDNSVINGFKTVDKKVSQYSEVEWGPSYASTFENRTYKKLEGTMVNEQQIRKKAAEFLGISDTSSMKVVENGKNTDFETYSVILSRPQEQGDITMDFTKKGGKLIWLLDNRSVDEQRLTYEEARDNALQFLKNHKYGEMQAVNYEEYANVANITFANMQNKIIIYPEKVSVKVALDNGEITGLQAADYIFAHKQRKLDKPQLSMSEAKKKLNPNFTVSGHSLALIEDELRQEVLCHQFTGKINGTRYRLYLNADSGLEVKLEQIV